MSVEGVGVGYREGCSAEWRERRSPHGGHDATHDRPRRNAVHLGRGDTPGVGEHDGHHRGAALPGAARANVPRHALQGGAHGATVGRLGKVRGWRCLGWSSRRRSRNGGTSRWIEHWSDYWFRRGEHGWWLLRRRRGFWSGHAPARAEGAVRLTRLRASLPPWTGTRGARSGHTAPRVFAGAPEQKRAPEYHAPHKPKSTHPDSLPRTARRGDAIHPPTLAPQAIPSVASCSNRATVRRALFLARRGLSLSLANTSEAPSWTAHLAQRRGPSARCPSAFRNHSRSEARHDARSRST